MDIAAIRKEMITAAKAAAQARADQWFNGGDGGACGFAWVMIEPKHKGNTKLGKDERKVLAELGFEKDWTGKKYQLWDPANWPGQSIDIKEAGAADASQVLTKHGFNAYPQSRLD